MKLKNGYENAGHKIHIDRVVGKLIHSSDEIQREDFFLFCFVLFYVMHPILLMIPAIMAFFFSRLYFLLSGVHYPRVLSGVFPVWSTNYGKLRFSLTFYHGALMESRGWVWEGTGASLLNAFVKESLLAHVHGSVS